MGISTNIILAQHLKRLSVRIVFAFGIRDLLLTVIFSLTISAI